MLRTLNTNFESGSYTGDRNKLVKEHENRGLTA